ncbi:MAG: hypothetical protein ACTS77_02120 [Arsenophonus sp. NC-TX2-MAG3]
MNKKFNLKLIKNLLDLLTNRIPFCVDKTVYMKADFLTIIAKGKIFLLTYTTKINKVIKILCSVIMISIN